MVKTKTAEEYNERYIRGSIMTFLDGNQTQRWIMGIIGDQKPLALGLLRDRLSEYGDPARREQLRQRLESAR